MTAGTRRELYTEISRRALTDSARECFTTTGYEATSVADLTARAQLSKGAFYRHFPDKRAAFIEVFVERLSVAAQLITQAHQELAGSPRGTGVVRTANAAAQFARLSVSDTVHRELLRQAPEVLGANLYQEIDDEHVLRPLVELLHTLVEREELIAGLPLETTGALLLRVLCAGNTLISRAEDRDAALTAVLTTVSAFFDGLIAPDLRS